MNVVVGAMGSNMELVVVSAVVGAVAAGLGQQGRFRPLNYMDL